MATLAERNRSNAFAKAPGEAHLRGPVRPFGDLSFAVVTTSSASRCISLQVVSEDQA
jgi:hypothetical protein